MRSLRSKKVCLSSSRIFLSFSWGVMVYPVPPVESLRALSLSNGQVERQNAPGFSEGLNLPNSMQAKRRKPQNEFRGKGFTLKAFPI